jgi:hypothetical protein
MKQSEQWFVFPSIWQIETSFNSLKVLSNSAQNLTMSIIPGRFLASVIFPPWLRSRNWNLYYLRIRLNINSRYLQIVVDVQGLMFPWQSDTIGPYNWEEMKAVKSQWELCVDRPENNQKANLWIFHRTPIKIHAFRSLWNVKWSDQFFIQRFIPRAWSASIKVLYTL